MQKIQMNAGTLRPQAHSAGIKPAFAPGRQRKPAGEWGLCLSGGGIRGGAHIGAIAALKEAGLTPSCVAGTSAGAIVAGLYGAGLNPQEMKRAALEIAKTPGILDFDCFGLIKSAAHLLAGQETGLLGFVKGNKLYKAFREATGGKRMTDSVCPLLLTSVDLCTKKRILFASRAREGWTTEAELAQGMRASMGIPVVFRPYDYLGMQLVDGGTLDPMPVLLTRELGADNVLAIDVGNRQEESCTDDVVEVVGRSLSILSQGLEEDDRRAAAYIFNPGIEGVGTLELAALEECIDLGYEGMRKAIPSVKEALRIST